ncbi:hypothetical protein D918_02388 [Trichuris suis]|uniref:RNase H type-1 domain-containing protein n=1 Tax=Trichuris suis TaxID=68888 RepID=A0A085MLQ5_9BILA|nr:hypothetical protein M513_00914 [Trichuris suis]KHJ47528.1 hypothetical protein D918_02388 [Trichuris suis]
MNKLQLMTDSSTVHRWICDGLSGKARLKTKAASEMLIRRRVGIVLALVKEYGLGITTTLVKSASNKADALTRIPQRWTESHATDPKSVGAAAEESDVERLIAKIYHEAGHIQA